jgi:hypothetical protein
MMAPWAAGAAVAGLAYAEAVAQGSSGPVSLPGAVRTFVELLGAAPLAFRPRLAFAGGLLGLGAAGFLVARVLARGGARRAASLPFAGLMLFALGVAAMVAWGRGAWPGSALAPRYMTFTNLFWVGLAGMAVVWAAPGATPRQRHARGRQALVAAGLIMLVICAGLASRRGYYRAEEYDRFHRPEARRMVVDRLPEPPPRLTTMLAGPFARELAFLRAHRLTVFAPNRFPGWAEEAGE